MSDVRDLHAKWRQDPAYRRAYDALGPEFQPARVLIEARISAGLTQPQLAERMPDDAIGCRPAGERVRSTPTRTLEKIARCTGTRLRISFEPVGAPA